MPSLRDRSTRKIIRLAYHGCANRPFFHFVVQPNRAPRNQKPIEQIGTYDPLPNIHNEKLVALDFDRLKYWYAYQGASLSKPVLQLLETRKELDPEVVTCIDKDKAKSDMTETTTEATTETTKDTITTTTEATTAVEDTTTIVTEEATTTEETTVMKKVKKPRAIKRRLDTSSESEAATFERASSSQVLEILTTNAKYKKGLVAAFKLLFRQDEYEGHSLSGRKNKNGGQRPALADQRKWSFLEGLCGYFPLHYTTRLDAHRIRKIKEAKAAKEKAAQEQKTAEENT